MPCFKLMNPLAKPREVKVLAGIIGHDLVEIGVLQGHLGLGGPAGGLTQVVAGRSGSYV